MSSISAISSISYNHLAIPSLTELLIINSVCKQFFLPHQEARVKLAQWDRNCSATASFKRKFTLLRASVSANLRIGSPSAAGSIQRQSETCQLRGQRVESVFRLSAFFHQTHRHALSLRHRHKKNRKRIHDTGRGKTSINAKAFGRQNGQQTHT